MRTLNIQVSDSIYEHIIFFLKSIPQNLISISEKTESPTIKNSSTKKRVEQLFKTNKVEAFKEIEDPIAWQKSIRDEWE